MGKKETVFKTKWFSVESEEFEHIPALEGKPIYRINTGDCVVILALTRDKKIVLVRQFRPTVNKYVTELPAGGVGNNEVLEKAAARELLEETGYLCQKLAYIGKALVAADRINGDVHIFFGKDAEKNSTHKAEEGIEVLEASLDELRTLVRKGEFEQLGCLGVILLIEWITGENLD